MTRWFRFYDDAINDPKVQRLAGDTFKAWVNVLCLASKNEGVLPCISDIAFALRLDEDQASDLLNQFYKLQLLDEVEVEDAPMSYTPHNWKARQYKSDVTDPTAATRQQRYRDAKRNADRNATVTVTATRADTEAYTEQKVGRAPKAIKKSRKKPQTPIAEPFAFSQRVRDYAKSIGFKDGEIAWQQVRFVRYVKDKSRLYADWDIAGENWFDKALEFAGKSPPEPKAEPIDDGLIEVLGEVELAAWDNYARSRGAASFPRNGRGGWRFPSRWPPGYVPPERSQEAPPIPSLRSMQ